jgi:hypothetical protein
MRNDHEGTRHHAGGPGTRIHEWSDTPIKEVVEVDLKNNFYLLLPNIRRLT